MTGCAGSTELATQNAAEVNICETPRTTTAMGSALDVAGSLINMGVPPPVAREASSRFGSDIHSALDWACSSDRRHSRPLFASPPDVIDLDLEEVQLGASNLPSSVVPPPAPQSWCTPQAADPSVLRMPPPCFLDDPAGEVDYWFRALANSNGAAALDEMVWRRMPLYSQYIDGHTLEEVRQGCVGSIRKQRGLDLTIQQAAKLPSVLGYTSMLPLAVACEYLHTGCGFPAIFAFDLFQACLASCQNKHLEVSLYANRSKSFTSKARWWACPTGDPNAGKSPTCSLIMTAFRNLAQSVPQMLFSEEHWIGVGNNNRIQNRWRLLDGCLLLYGPESKPILDPHFPTKKTVDTGKFLDLTRWLECANGGRFEWGTGQDEKDRASRKSRQEGTECLPTTFEPTNINMCLFQQCALFEEWWCQVEASHKCGFSARILMSPTARAIVDGDTGLQDPEPVCKLMQKIWRHVLSVYGPQSALKTRQMTTTLEAQEIVRALYYDLAEEEDQGGWGSAAKSSLGKMEYRVPSAACLTFLATSALQAHPTDGVLDDNAMKCALRHFDLRVVHTCSIIDACIRACARKASSSKAAASSAIRPTTARVLESCVKDPILFSHMSQRFVSLRGADKFDARLALLRELERLGLGQVKETRRRVNEDNRAVAFYRFPLSPTVQESLCRLGVAESFWHPSLPIASSPATPTTTAAITPAMQGAGKRGRRQEEEQQQDQGGQEEEVVRKGGRKSAEEVGRIYTQKSVIACENPFLDKKAFMEHERRWATATVPGQQLALRRQYCAYKGGHKIFLWCNSCTSCKERSGWRGYSIYDDATKQITRAYTPQDQRGDFKAVKTWNPLTATAEHGLKAFVADNHRFTLQDLVKVVEKHQARPSDTFLSTWAKNHRPHRGTPEDRLTSHKWVEADWRQLERELGTVHNLTEASDTLKITASVHTDDATVVVFCNPLLLKETLGRLDNQKYIKLCGDGTFRLTRDEWVLMTVGVLSKRISCFPHLF